MPCYSRHIVGWMIADWESAVLAEVIIELSGGQS